MSRGRRGGGKGRGGRRGNGGPPSGGPRVPAPGGGQPGQVDPRQLVAQQVANFLAQMFPERAKMSPERVEEVAMACGGEMPQFMQVFGLYAPPRNADTLRIRLMEPPTLIGSEPKMVAELQAPLNPAKATDPETRMKSICILAIVSSPWARALAYWSGYHMEIKALPAAANDTGDASDADSGAVH